MRSTKNNTGERRERGFGRGGVITKHSGAKRLFRRNRPNNQGKTRNPRLDKRGGNTEKTPSGEGGESWLWETRKQGKVEKGGGRRSNCPNGDPITSKRKRAGDKERKHSEGRERRQAY